MSERFSGSSFRTQIQHLSPEKLKNFYDNLFLLNKSYVRRLVRLQLPPVEVPLPEILSVRTTRAILVSNYPSVESTLSSLMVLGTTLPGEELRLKAIARESVITRAPWWLKLLGFHHAILPATKDEKTGEYTLGRKTVSRMISHMKTPGAILWLSATGQTYPNDLSLELAKPGPGWISSLTQTPILPMAINQEGGVVSKLSFGEPIFPPIKREELNQMTDIDRATLYINQTREIIKAINELMAS